MERERQQNGNKLSPTAERTGRRRARPRAEPHGSIPLDWPTKSKIPQREVIRAIMWKDNPINQIPR